MGFELAQYPVESLAWGRETRWRDGRLTLDRDALTVLAATDRRLAEVELDLAQPGDAVRIVHGLDVVEPRCKAQGTGTAFPGFLGPPETGGQGRTNALAGAAVVTTGEFADATFDTVVSVAEAIIDMSGPLARLSPFASTRNLVLSCRQAIGVPAAQAAAAIRLAALRLADALAAATRGAEPARIQRVPETVGEPRMVVICQLASTGSLYDTFVYGRSVEGMLPTVLLPEELADGAVVSGNYRFANHRTSTHTYQNHPVLSALASHGLRPAGVIVLRGYANDQTEKERVAAFCVKLARLLGASGAVICPEAGGHAMMETMLVCRACETAGIRTALISEELAGPDGSDNPFVDSTPEADLIISAGNQDERVEFPFVERVIGGERLLESGQPALGGGHIWLRSVYGSTNQSGAAHLRAHAF